MNSYARRIALRSRAEQNNLWEGRVSREQHGGIMWGVVMADSRIFINGRIFTSNRDDLIVEAIGIEGGRIRSVGDERTVRDALGRNVEEVDLDSRTLLPGFIDAHNHYLATAEALTSINARFPTVRSVEDLVAAVAERAATTPKGKWIRAFGMDDVTFEDGRTPTRWDLDEATRDHPVIVYHVSGHHALVNSVAFQTRGISDDVGNPKGGQFIRDEDGRLTGFCLDTAMQLILPVAVEIGCHGPNFHTQVPLEDLVAYLDEAGPAYLAAGLTTVCDPQVTLREMTAYREARRQGKLYLRTVCMPLSHQLDALMSIGLAGPFGDDWLRIGGMKLYCDGALTGGTAAFTEPYGRNRDTGSTYWSPEELAELVGRAHAAGWQVGIHTQGDRAMQMSLDAISQAMLESPQHEPRHRIEHAGYPTPPQIEQMTSMDLIPVHQPLFLYDSGDMFLDELGGRAHGLQPYRAEIEHGIPVVLSSDSFVASYPPLETIAAAMQRRTRSGAPIGEEQAMTIEEAILAYTIDAAVSIRMEDRIGSLEPGKLADLVVVDGDLFGVSPDQVAGLPIWMTVLEGEIVSGTYQLREGQAAQ